MSEYTQYLTMVGILGLGVGLVPGCILAIAVYLFNGDASSALRMMLRLTISLSAAFILIFTTLGAVHELRERSQQKQSP
jgi:high-affinity Fe2+/Pb2+ permease